jgi:hypothetical protein
MKSAPLCLWPAITFVNGVPYCFRDRCPHFNAWLAELETKVAGE